MESGKVHKCLSIIHMCACPLVLIMRLEPDDVEQ